MGYYTYYRLNIHKDNREPAKKNWTKLADIKKNDPYGEEQWENDDDPIAVLRGFSEEAEYALDEDGNCSGEDTQWYDHEKDLIRLSEMFPDIIFRLRGNGQYPQDMWEKYYKNGKSQLCKARITFDPFDEDKLKEYEDPTKRYKIKKLK
jgi:hypothetical protein